MNTPASIKGAAKSITIWVGGLLVVLGQLAPYVNEATLVSLGLHGRSLQIALTLSGLLMGACRIITKNSLADKGEPAPAAAPVPPTTPETPK
jgi:hypothetical protein